MRFLGCILFCCRLVTTLAAASAPTGPEPLRQAHSHNDYVHERPLHEALELGYCSVEADVYLVEGQLLVGHDRKDLKPGRTLEALYLDPLQAIARANGGRIHRGVPTLTLLIDVKTEADATYRALDAVLGRYAALLTTFTADRTEPRAVTVIISGNRAVDLIAQQPLRRAAIDGRVADLEGKSSAGLIPWISANWNEVSKWRGNGEMPAADREKLARWVAQAHQQGRALRFWNTPDTPAMWTFLLAAGVDIIGADHLAPFRDFLVQRPAGRP